MFWNVLLGLLALFMRDVVAASAVYQDRDLGLTFSSDTRDYKIDRAGRAITWRIAIPSDVGSQTPFDVVLQVVAPNEVGWAGLAWNGAMQKNPLSVFWKASNNQLVVSSRWSPAHTAPTPYAGATYTVLKAGTKTNSTHWQITVKCTGCSSWADSTNGGIRYLSPRGGVRIAWAMDFKVPGASNTSALTYHEVHNYFDSDFNLAANRNFATAVAALVPS